MAKIETVNDALVSAAAFDDGRPAIIMLRAPPAGSRFDHDTALRIAAWLVALADGPALDDDGAPLKDPVGEGSARTRFDQVLEAVRNT